MTLNKKLILLLLFLLNFSLGLAFINEGLFHYDSVVLAKAVENTYKTGQLQEAVRGRYGCVIINSIIYLPFFKLGQNADFAIRFSSILFHSLSIVALFLFIYELFADSIQAIAGALLLSFTPFYFSPNTYGKEHGLSIFLLLLSFYLLLRGLKKNALYLIGISSFILAFSVSVKESILLIVPLYFLFYLSPVITISPFKITVPRERLKAGTLLSLILPFLVVFFVIFFTYLKAEFYREMYVKDSTSAIFLGLFSRLLKDAFGDLFKSIPALTFLFSIIGFKRLINKGNIFLPFFLLLWFMLIFYFGNVITYGARYLDIVIIPVYILASYALSWLYAKDKLAACAIVAYLAFAMFMFMYPVLSFRHRYNGEKQFALFVREKTEDKALIISMDDSVFIEYYAQRKILTHPLSDRKQMTIFLRRVAVSLVNNIPVYLTGSGLSYDKQGIFRNILLTNFDMKIVGSKLSEDYHRAEMGFTKYDQTLFKLDFKYK